jgi:hypothetical protein
MTPSGARSPVLGPHAGLPLWLIPSLALQILKFKLTDVIWPVFSTSPTQRVYLGVTSREKFRTSNSVEPAWSLWARPNSRLFSNAASAPFPLNSYQDSEAGRSDFQGRGHRRSPQRCLDNRSGLFYRQNGIQREGAGPGSVPRAMLQRSSSATLASGIPTRCADAGCCNASSASRPQTCASFSE